MASMSAGRAGGGIESAGSNLSRRLRAPGWYGPKCWLKTPRCPQLNRESNVRTSSSCAVEPGHVNGSLSRHRRPDTLAAGAQRATVPASADGPRSASSSIVCDQPAEVLQAWCPTERTEPAAQSLQIKGEEADECFENSNNNRVLPGADGRGILTRRKGGRVEQENRDDFQRACGDSGSPPQRVGVLPAGTYVFKILDSQSDRHISSRSSTRTKRSGLRHHPGHPELSPQSD
jgi:hypothetical protein